MYSMRKRMWIWKIEACKSIVVDCKHKMMNTENDQNRSSLNCESNIGSAYYIAWQCTSRSVTLNEFSLHVSSDSRHEEWSKHSGHKSSSYPQATKNVWRGICSASTSPLPHPVHPDICVNQQTVIKQSAERIARKFERNRALLSSLLHTIQKAGRMRLTKMEQAARERERERELETFFSWCKSGNAHLCLTVRFCALYLNTKSADVLLTNGACLKHLADTNAWVFRLLQHYLTWQSLKLFCSHSFLSE